MVKVAVKTRFNYFGPQSNLPLEIGLHLGNVDGWKICRLIGLNCRRMMLNFSKKIGSFLTDMNWHFLVNMNRFVRQGRFNFIGKKIVRWIGHIFHFHNLKIVRLNLVGDGGIRSRRFFIGPWCWRQRRRRTRKTGKDFVVDIRLGLK